MRSGWKHDACVRNCVKRCVAEYALSNKARLVLCVRIKRIQYCDQMLSGASLRRIIDFEAEISVASMVNATNAPAGVLWGDATLPLLLIIMTSSFVSGTAICLIIPCSSAPTLSNNIIQK